MKKYGIFVHPGKELTTPRSFLLFLCVIVVPTVPFYVEKRLHY